MSDHLSLQSTLLVVREQKLALKKVVIVFRLNSYHGEQSDWAEFNEKEKISIAMLQTLSKIGIYLGIEVVLIAHEPRNYY